MTQGFVGDLTIFVLALLVGFEVISKVPATLHTPLMSGANSIHGVVLVGVVILSSFVDGPFGYVLTFLAAAFGAANVVGGYAVTDRMLQMFRKRPVPAARRTGRGAGELHERCRERRPAGVAVRRGRLRARPAPDELPGHRPARQPAVGVRHAGRGHRGAGRRSATAAP